MGKELELLEKMQKDWNAFKSDNDARLAAIEKKGAADPLLVEKVENTNKGLSDLRAEIDLIVKASKRVPTGEGGEDEAKKAEHSKAFARYMRTGDASAIKEIKAAVTLGSDPEGGYGVPETLDAEIEQYERDNTPMRGECRVISVDNENYEKLLNKGSAASGWVDELESRGETTAPTLAALKPSFGEVYANPAISQKALDDLRNAEAWLAEEVGVEFGEQENDAFTAGSGVKKPKGILGYSLSTSADASLTIDQIQKVHSGSSGAFVADKLIELFYALKRGYRKNAKWMMSATAVMKIRQLKDGQNNYLFQPSIVADTPDMLLGKPIVENDDVPVPAADANAAIFGDFRRGYYIVDVRGTRVLRDPYTAKPKVLFYSTKRVGGFVANHRALKVYTLST